MCGRERKREALVESRERISHATRFSGSIYFFSLVLINILNILSCSFILSAFLFPFHLHLAPSFCSRTIGRQPVVLAKSTTILLCSLYKAFQEGIFLTQEWRRLNQSSLKASSPHPANPIHHLATAILQQRGDQKTGAYQTDSGMMRKPTDYPKRLLI